MNLLVNTVGVGLATRQMLKPVWHSGDCPGMGQDISASGSRIEEC